MSIHPSLRSKFSSKGHRNVLKRLERIKQLKEEEKWTEEKNSVFNLPKVRSIKVRAKAKAKGPAAAGEAGAAPAAGAKPAAGKAAPAAKAAAKPAAKPAAKK